MFSDYQQNIVSKHHSKQRIVELDLLRGFALFGIFLMNIVSMAHPVEAYSNPMVLLMSGLTHSESVSSLNNGILNHIVFSLNHVFVNQKMMSLFSLLFGASTFLLLSALKEQEKSSTYYFKRNGLLVLFGLLHSIFIFFGDILFIYGLCAFVLYWFSALRPKWQFILGLVIYCLPIMQQGLMQLSINNFSINLLQHLNDVWQPSAEMVKEIVEYRQSLGYWEWVLTTIEWHVFSYDYGQIYNWYWDAVTVEAFLRSFGMMLVGMSFCAWGVLPNRDKKKSTLFYLKMLIAGFIVGLTLTLIGLWLNYHHAWEASYSAVGGRLLSLIATPFLACAYLALLILWSRKVHVNWVERLKQKLQAVGRMALTNYIMQSTVGLFLFTGVGFGLYGQLNRLELVAVVFALCLFQLWFSNLWLQRYRYGPLEWLWRSLTYGKLMQLTQ